MNIKTKNKKSKIQKKNDVKLRAKKLTRKNRADSVNRVVKKDK